MQAVRQSDLMSSCNQARSHRLGDTSRMGAVEGASRPYVSFEPTDPQVVTALLRLAGVGERDRVVDLGAGDGRIVVAAARDFGARGVGFEINPRLVSMARERARTAGVEDLAQFVQQDLFEADLRAATVVTLFLLPEVNVLLRPKLLAELAPGARIISHTHGMGDWRPEKTRHVRDPAGWYHRLHRWSIPVRALGTDDGR